MDSRLCSLKKESANKEKEWSVAVINGPNINMLGIREPDIYGCEKWSAIEHRLKEMATGLGINLVFFQSNHEGAIVDFIQEVIQKIDGVIINPAAYTKTGYAILDALTSIDIPFVEVHMSNIFSRGGWHSESIFSCKAIGQITGFKGYVYDLGLLAISNFISKKHMSGLRS
jgi:3-dehydroquinate dehydratase-2